MGRTLNLKALAEALATDAGQLSRESKRAGFPFDLIGGKKLFDLAEVTAWRAGNVKASGRKVAKIAAGPALPAASEISPVPVAGPKPIVPLADGEDEFIRELISGKASAVTIGNAAMQLAARQLARQAQAGQIHTQTFDSLKRAVEEMRKVDADSMDIAVRRGELIERSIAMEIIGACAQRLVQVGTNMATAAAQQCEVWDGDAVFLALAIDAKKRARIEWFAAQFNQVRALEAAEIEALLREQASPQAPAENVNGNNESHELNEGE